MIKFKYPLLSVLLLLNFLPETHSQDPHATYVHTITGKGNPLPSSYVPPVVSNGSLSMQVDFTGAQAQREYVGMIPGIYRAGRRYDPPSNALIPFGHFGQELRVKGKLYDGPDSWSQTLNTKEGTVSCRNDYGDVWVETTVFVPLAHDLAVIKKKFGTTSSEAVSVRFSFRYQFTPPGEENAVPWRVASQSKWDAASGSMEFRYSADSYQPCEGGISVFSDAPVQPVLEGQKIDLPTEIALLPGETKEITYYLVFADSMEGEDYERRLRGLREEVRRDGFDGLLKAHRADWNAYWEKSFVRIPDKKLEKVYHTAQYHLRANATRWSFPVGIFPTHWKGMYFGWDEMFCFQALASSNHLDISRRVPEFRLAGLPVAQRRVSHYRNPGKYGARYPWIVLETGAVEGASNGFWLDHVFHMSNIALSSWLQYLYNGDRAYLDSTGYPVMRECARFFVSHMVYRDSDGDLYIGKVTDLERLGPAKERAFMTTCGAIYTMETAAEASGILGVDGEEAESWRRIASKLRASLPHDGEKYLPYPGCTEKSVAALGGLFPYPLFDASNELQYEAAYDFYANARIAGNMYPVGSGISPWYAGWIAAALALLEDKDKPAELLQAAAASAGCFNELFEINEAEVSMHPWFSTASGNVVYALNQMLLQSKGDRLSIAPAVPGSWKDFSYKLAAYGDVVATVSVSGGRLSRLQLSSGDAAREIERTLILSEQYLEGVQLNREVVVSRQSTDKYVQLRIKFRGQVNLIVE